MYSVCWIIWESLETSAKGHGDWREQNKSDRGRGAIQRRRVELPGDDGSLAELREERAGGRSTGSKEGASGAGEPEHVSGCRARAERLKTSEGHRRSWNKSWRPRRDHPCGRGEGRTVPWGGTPPSGDAGRWAGLCEAQAPAGYWALSRWKEVLAGVYMQILALAKESPE